MSEEEERKRPEWQYKTEFHLVGEMRKVVELARKSSEKELASLRRKLQKLQYGS